MVKMNSPIDVPDDLHGAIKKKDLKAVLDILASLGNGSLVNDVICNHTALTLAIELKLSEITEAILAFPHTDVNASDRFGRTGLYFASKTGPISLVEHIISRGAHVGQSTPSILHGCAFGDDDNEAIVYAILKCGVDVNVVDERGRTPLFIAVSNSLVNVTKALIKSKTNINAVENEYGRTPLIQCASNTPITIDVNSQEKYMKSLRILNILLENGADVNAKDVAGHTALHNAIKNDNMLASLKLIQWGGSHNSYETTTIKSVFEMALAKKHFEIAFILFLNFYRYFSTYSRSFFYKTKNYFQEEQFNPCQFSMVLKECLDGMLALNFSREEENTFSEEYQPFIEGLHIPTLQFMCRHCVLRSSNSSLMKEHFTYLPTAKTLQRYIFFNTHFSSISLSLLADLHIATYTRNIAVLVSKLNSHVVNIPFNNLTLLEVAISRRSVFITNLLLDNGADPNLETREGLRPLHKACRHGCVNTVHTLLDHGADVNAVDKQGNLPIHIACSTGHFGVAETLILYGSEFSSPDNFGRFPIHYSSASGNWQFTSTLLRLGIDASVTDSFGYTGLHLASSKGNLYLLKNIELPYMFEKEVIMKGHMFVLKYSCNIKCAPKPKYSSGVNHAEVIKQILQSGCSKEMTHETTNRKKSALDIAKDYNFQEVISILT